MPLDTIIGIKAGSQLSLLKAYQVHEWTWLDHGSNTYFTVLVYLFPDLGFIFYFNFIYVVARAPEH